jgi:phosphoglycerol transferase MdoB-like AlkP superfamily enzyme
LELSESMTETRCSWLTRRHGGVVIFLGVFLSICLLIRLSLLAKSAHDVSWDASILAILGWGLLFDFASDWLPSFGNNFNRELAGNGVWSLFAAFRNNELEYERFYATLPVGDTFATLRHELTEDGSILLRPDDYDTLRYVENPGPEQHLNIVQITVESLSADFVGAWNAESKLTPNLDALARQSMVFTRCYATGTRTDRGMEALALSLPPTPGRSIIKRPQNENMFTLGSVLRTKGYDTAFI